MSAESAVRDGNPAGFDLIETMRWEPATGFVRFDRHLARLYASAHVLGFSYDPGRIGETLKNAIGRPGIALRARLVLSADGNVTASTQPYEPLPPSKVWNLRIARVRLGSADPLVRHKTSRREAYIKARSEYQVHQADEVILLNERGEICEGTITNIFVDHDDDLLVTPPLSSGLLPGVLRAELLDTGRAREAVLGPTDLMDAKGLFVGNSLRGLIPARFVC
jgi:4-amino-4-deoxychorismate lyase